MAPISNEIFQVKDRDRGGKVNFSRRTCSCRKWRLSGLPCGHVISVLRSLNYDDCSPYAHPAFTTETYRSTYEELIHPLNAPVDWEIPEDLMTVNVPVMEVPKPDRPKNKDRIPS